MQLRGKEPRPRADMTRHEAAVKLVAVSAYFAPVVPAFGFGEQFRCCGWASF